MSICLWCFVLWYFINKSTHEKYCNHLFPVFSLILPIPCNHSRQACIDLFTNYFQLAINNACPFRNRLLTLVTIQICFPSQTSAQAITHSHVLHSLTPTHPCIKLHTYAFNIFSIASLCKHSLNQHHTKRSTVNILVSIITTSTALIIQR